MNQVLTEPAPPTSRRAAPLARGAVVVIVSLAMIALGLWLVRDPSFVDRVEVRNPTGYDLNIDITGSDRDGWLPISVATGGNNVTSTDEVVDQGDTWIFRFNYAGYSAGELRVPRSQLQDADWRVVVPDVVARRLLDQGVLPGP
jgi:hypothetical protein